MSLCEHDSYNRDGYIAIKCACTIVENQEVQEGDVYGNFMKTKAE